MHTLVDKHSDAVVSGPAPKVRASNVNVFYGEKQALQNVSVDVPDRGVMSFIGPSGCGKSTFLRCINRMNDTVASAKVTGRIIIDNQDIYDKSLDVVQLRARVGMVFQKPNPFPKSIFDNVAYGPRIHGLSQSKADLQDVVQSSLEKAGLWKEVKDRLTRGHWTFRRPAAAPVHCARHRGEP